MGNKRTYQVNDLFFSKLTKRSAYWLGFIYADGYISKTENCIRITLSAKDEDHLEKFKKDIKSESPITYHMNRYSEKYPLTKKARISIFSNKLKTDLHKWGCTTAKSLTCEFPNIPEGLIPHFLRGYFDGDGSVFIVKPHGRMKNPSIGASMIGTEQFLLKVKDLLGFDDTKKLHVDKRLGDSSIRNLGFAGSNVIKRFYDYLYKDADVFLDRKKDVFDRFWINKDAQRL